MRTSKFEEQMEQEAYRHVPYDIDVEQALLGAILADNRAMERASALIKQDTFYDPLHGRIFATMSQMIERGGVVVTPLTLHATLKSDPGVIETGGQAYFDALRAASPAIPNVKDYADILNDLAIRRNLIRIGEDIVNAAYDAPTEKTSREQIEEAEKALYAVAETTKYGEGALDFHQAMQKTVELATKAQARGGQISGVTSGFIEIDRLLGGLQPSDLLILGGRPGSGKTSLSTNMAFHAARQYMRDLEQNAEFPSGAPVLFFSLEMAAQQLSARILSEQCELEGWKIRNGRLSDSEWDKFVLTMQDLSNLPLYIDDTGGISIAQIAARSRRLKREKNIGLIVIDYIQLVAGSRAYENRVQEVSEVTKGLKTLAKELNVPILALSQLSRGVDARDDKRPVLSDLRESGSIEQDADVVMFVYREEYYLGTREPEAGTPEHVKWVEKMERVTNRAEVLVEKHRHGATRAIDLAFEGQYTRFSNLAEDQVQR
ncbi:MAG TPA: replicative DNA helicase [Rhizomicrobium sp.]|nr:replicative DNA helicase [Rhizomicrobium sp.]